MVSNFSVVPICWLLAIRLLRVCLFSFRTHAVQEKFVSKLLNSKVKFTQKNRYRTHHFVIHAISVFSVKSSMEFTS